MSLIAEKYLGDRNKWELIAKANPLVDPTRLKIGTKLVIPAKPAATSGNGAGSGGAPLPSASPTLGAGEQSHTVAAGDTLISLSRKYYGKDALWELIYDANKKTIGDDPAGLKVGMKLVIPAKPADPKPKSN
jgi:nucleoid-associated protein YgaU